MPTKRAILAQLSAKELRASADRYELHVDDRRVKAQLVDVLAGSRKVGLDELLPELSRNRLKELCGALSLDDSGRKKADLVVRLLAPAPVLKIGRGQAPPAVSRPVEETPVPPAEIQGATSGHEAELWRMADALRGSMDAAEYKHVVLGLIFLKYISDAFEEMHARLEGEQDEGADPEDPDEYRAENIFWVPPEARWSHLKAQAKQPVVGRLVDDAMTAIERDNSVLKDVLPKDYARPALDKQRLGQLIDMISNIRVGDADARSKDVLGRVYEYFLSQFASAEGKKGGEFYTPALHRQASGRDAGAIPGTGLRSLLRLVRDVRPVRRVHPRARYRQRERRQGTRRHLRLRPGVELHYVAARQDEPRHPRHRGPNRSR